MTSRSASILVGLSMLLYATPSLSTYTIPSAATTQGGGSGTDGQYHIFFTTGQASPVGISSASTYSLTSGLIYALSEVSDVVPPVLAHVPTTLVTEYTPVEIQVSVNDDRTGVESVMLYYHEGGLSVFREKQMQPGQGDLYAATIPASSVSEKGLVYYIQAKDQAENVSYYPGTAPDSVISLKVWFADLMSAITVPASSYRMISLPGSTNGDPDSVLVDDLGAYDKKAWRLGRWNASAGECGEYCYDEYPSIADFDPGRAFWLISSKSTGFDFSGLSTDISRPFAVRLEKGWNQIGTPFAFTTDWLSADIVFGGEIYTVGDEHVVGSDTIFVEDNLISYDGTYNGFESELEPWTGYWVRNSSTAEVGLRLYPEIPASVLAKSPYPGDPVDVLLALKIKSEESGQRTSYAGMSRQAKDGWDVLDHREPPVIGSYVRAVFVKDTWGRHSGTYMCDIKAFNEQGAAWEVSAQASEPTRVTFDVEPVVGLPDRWEIVVYDTDAGMRLTADELPYQLKLDRSRDLFLIAGTEDYIQTHEAQSGIQLKAQIIAVSPNPFSHTTKISFFVPKQERVRLEVFSVEGRLVDTLTDSQFGVGIHTAVWDGASANHGRAAPGIYFLRLETLDAVHTSKILKLR